jgi:hypothetical protein
VADKGRRSKSNRFIIAQLPHRLMVLYLKKKGAGSHKAVGWQTTVGINTTTASGRIGKPLAFFARFWYDDCRIWLSLGSGPLYTG